MSLYGTSVAMNERNPTNFSIGGNMKLILALLLIAPATYAETTSMNDSQIAAVVKTANQGEIDAGKHAKSHAKDAKVKKFASEMVMHHTQADKDASKVLSKINVKPEQNQASEELERSVKADMDTMKSLKGHDYDVAYIHSQVTTHESVLNSLDHSLIPNAKNADLKAMLEKTRSTVAKHLDEAKSIEASL
jgi:putative membrane protein